MSAIGSGVMLICGSQLDGYAGSPPATGVAPAMVPLFVGFGGSIIISHYVRRKAWQVLISDENGNIMPMAPSSPPPNGFSVSQALSGSSAPDTITIAVDPDYSGSVFIAIRWQENSVEAQLFPVGSMNASQSSPRTASSTQGNVTVALTAASPPG